MGLHYFISDVHLGLDYKDPVARERRFASFLESLPQETQQVFLLGDIFDFWYEYKNVVPRGFTRTLGVLASLVDRGVKVYFLNGNHDIWTYSYLQQEIGVEVHKQLWIKEIDGARFCLGHGDNLWYKSTSYSFLQFMFKSRVVQLLFSGIHPRWAFLLGHTWSRHNRLTRYKGEDDQGQKEFKKKIAEQSAVWAAGYQKKLEAAGQKRIDHFIFGHHHVPLLQNLEGGGDLSVLGDWIHHPDYLVFDGKSLERVCL